MWVLMLLLHAAGRREADYATLMAVSGWSGQFVYEPRHKRWTTYLPPHDETVKLACAAVGARYQTLVAKNPEDSFALIRSAVDAGQGLMADYWESLIFCGYQDAAKAEDRKVFWVCTPFAGDGKWWTWSEFLKEYWGGPWASHPVFIEITGRTEPAPARQVAEDTLKSLVKMARTEYWKGRKIGETDLSWSGGVLTGLAAIAKYAEDVADFSKTMESPAHKDDYYFTRSWGCFEVYPQWTARKCTAVYLSRVADQFKPPVSDELRTAAKEYDAAFEAWKGLDKYLGRQEHIPLDQRVDQADRWSLKDNRRAGTEAIRKALEHERNAIARLERALAAR